MPTRIAGSCGAAGATVAQAERLLSARILAVDGKTDFDRDMVLASRADLVVYGAIARLESSAARPRVVRTRRALGRRLHSWWHPSRRQPPRFNPILARLAVVALLIFLLGTWYFHSAFGWLDAVYFVVTTMTTTGYGDLSPDRNNPIDIIAAMLLMLSGTPLRASSSHLELRY